MTDDIMARTAEIDYTMFKNVPCHETVRSTIAAYRSPLGLAMPIKQTVQSKQNTKFPLEIGLLAMGLVSKKSHANKCTCNTLSSKTQERSMISYICPLLSFTVNFSSLATFCHNTDDGSDLFWKAEMSCPGRRSWSGSIS